MAREFELKLEIPNSAVSKVMRLPWLWELASGELKASHLASTYFDTPNCTLRRKGVTLRVRRTGSRYVQTLKAAVNGGAVPVERDEWEEEIPGAEPELKLLADTPLRKLSKSRLQRRLQPRFEVHIDRSAFPIQSANSDIEIAIDRAKVIGPNEASSFCEIELELKRGAASELARIARRIAAEIPAALSLKTKADRGFAILDGELPRTHFAERIQIGASHRIGMAFQATGWSCLRHLALNRDAVAIGDAAAVHQMRVGVRRLRTAIYAFRRLVDGPETDAIKAELKWLANELRRARELDVLLGDALAPLRHANPDDLALAALCEDVALRRGAALDQAHTAVTSDRYRQMVLRIAFWLVASEWSDTKSLAPSRRVGPFAERTLSRLTQRLSRTLPSCPELDPRQRHKLRIQVKTLRYAAEFFSSALENKASQRSLLGVLRTLQDDLGRLTDIAAHERLRDILMASWTEESAADALAAQKALGLGLALGKQEGEKEARLAAIGKSSRALSSLARRSN